MHRIDSPGATQDNRFTEGNPQVGIPPTVVSAEWMNAVQEELVTVITNAGIVLDKETNTQLMAAIDVLISDAAPALATTELAGVVKPDGTTITIASDGSITAVSPAYATTEAAGLVERATDAEVITGTDTEKYVTPKQMVSNAAKVDLSNVSATGKELAVGWGMPDYGAGVSISPNMSMLATQDIYVFCSFEGANGYAVLFVNDTDNFPVSSADYSTGAIPIASFGGNFQVSAFLHDPSINGFVNKGKYYKIVLVNYIVRLDKGNVCAYYPLGAIDA